ncbi:hypothetical protein NDU88_002146 [Pleurodeles waltl]|uniref:Uncharacterized protein n=1 Tax=Pleurodeles waltl TaxID=8319 RepID=A0AAV7U954_PLEWA|nr:hypothetical protein NDU88_002146 [Pleurodeles waltl]
MSSGPVAGGCSPSRRRLRRERADALHHWRVRVDSHGQYRTLPRAQSVVKLCIGSHYHKRRALDIHSGAHSE